MKIDQMQKRENFAEINKNTLGEYFSGNDGEKTYLYVYPKLNAIITKKPSKQVKEYLYTEYNLRNGGIKGIIIKLYLFVMLNSFGFFSSEKIKVNAKVKDSVLIYPCNKKYRIFRFADNEVDVIVKSGFGNRCLVNETEFRNNHKAEFILPLIKSAERKYTERIIDGVPLARLGTQYEEKCDEAIGMWRIYSAESRKTVTSESYVENLCKKIEDIRVSCDKNIDVEKLNRVTDKLAEMILGSTDELETILSHGDLQPGNIWVENKTGKTYIIDWESWDIRCSWYDEALLYSEIRKEGKIQDYLKNNSYRGAAVVLEDICFRMAEINDLPEDYGINEFDVFLSEVEKCLNI